MGEIPESEIKRQKVIDAITNWCEYTKVFHLLRNHDIPGLASTILDVFYSSTFCCGHKGMFDDGVHIAFKDFDNGEECEVSGLYCRVCAEEYKKDSGAWEVRDGS